MSESAARKTGSDYLDHANKQLRKYYPDRTGELLNHMLENPEDYPEIWIDGWENYSPEEKEEYWERI